jgi:acyl-CoA synthetase (AMP-forming)/AMP-acid ligase II
MSDHGNIAMAMAEVAARVPDRVAVKVARTRGSRTRYREITFGELDARVRRTAAALGAVGIDRGTTTILMVPPGIELFVLAFALFRIGAVPVLVAPGMGVRNMVRCLGSVEASAFIGIPKAHLLRLAFRSRFASVRTLVTVGRPRLWGGHSLDSLVAAAPDDRAVAATAPSDPAAILFTSGSTGPPKGAIYRHEVFRAQVDMLRSAFGYGDDEIDLATFPLFALFDAALGITCVVPDMDATRPGSVEPGHILGPIRELGVTTMFGSPALLDRIERVAHRDDMRSLRRVISAGAPVHRRLIAGICDLLPEGSQLWTPYGATEALPVAMVGSDELEDPATQTQSLDGWGVCIGREVPGMEVRLIGITDEPIPSWDDALLVTQGEIGEVVVGGPVVTHGYHRAPEHDATHKIRDGDRILHRMGDLARRDDQGRLWFCGRKSHRVETADGLLCTVPVEVVFNQHADVHRTALVGIGDPPGQRPVVCVELAARVADNEWPRIESELGELAAAHPHTAGLDTFLRHECFPVDIRHNAKIFREKLRPWATAQLRES